jgi:hypothetical protein
MPKSVSTVLFVLAICWSHNAEAATLTLAWDPPSDGVTTGYVIYYGTASHSYSQQVNVGFVTSYTVTGLAAATTYYFIVRAYDATGAFSDPSGEISGMTPANQPPTVFLTVPAEGASFLTSDTVPMQATAFDDGSIQSVTFLLNGSPIGAPDTSYPYATTISGLAPGNYALTAIATDDLLATTTAAAVHFSVTNPGSRTNVALAANGGVASGSSSYGAGYGPEGAINGDRRGQPWGAGGGWADATPNQFPDTFEVQFNGAKTISEIDVFSVQDNYLNPSEPTPAMTFTLGGLQNFDVQYWTGITWQTVSGGAIVGNTLVWRQITFAPITTTKIRLVINFAVSTYTGLAELEAWTVSTPPPPSRANVALASNGGVASGSSSYGAGYGPEGAINGDRRGQPWGAGGGWADATPNQFPDTFEVQFNGAKTISEIDVFSVQDNYLNPSEPTPAMTFTLGGLLNFDVQYWTGATWQTVSGGAIVGNTLVWRQITFAPITTTKIRLVINSAVSTYAGLAELEAWTVPGGS